VSILQFVFVLLLTALVQLDTKNILGPALMRIIGLIKQAVGMNTFTKRVVLRRHELQIQTFV